MRGSAKLVANCVLLEPGMRGCTVKNWVLPITECFQINSGFGSPETLLRPLKSLILAFICQIVIGFSLGFCFTFADLFCHYMFLVL